MLVKLKLGNVSKMPGKSWGISAKLCGAGGRLHKVAGSICADCYALKGFYLMSSVERAHAERLDAYNADPVAWVDAMVDAISRTREPRFRWFDSGDLQSVAMLADICRVARLTPEKRHWLPTKEYGFVRRYIADGGTIPPNLVVRLSGFFVDQPVPEAIAARTDGVEVSGSHHGAPLDGYAECPAYKQDGTAQCAECDLCWRRDTRPSYGVH
mgnify:CR=1 FL=1